MSQLQQLISIKWSQKDGVRKNDDDDNDDDGDDDDVVVGTS